MFFYYDHRGTRHLFVGEQAEAQARAEGAQLAKKVGGDAVRWPDGSQDFTTRTVLLTPDGGEIWHEDGNRIRCQIVRVHVQPDGSVERKRGRKVWVHVEHVYS